MWPLIKKEDKEEQLKRDLLGVKEVKIEKFKFLIKKINPILDFPPDKIPELFTDFISHRKTGQEKAFTEQQLKKVYESMYAVIEAGLYSPILVKPEKDNSFHEKGLTIKDLFIDEEIGYKLYIEIMAHSLNRFKGIVGSFFLRKLKRLLYIQWPLNTALLLPL